MKGFLSWGCPVKLSVQFKGHGKDPYHLHDISVFSNYSQLPFGWRCPHHATAASPIFQWSNTNIGEAHYSSMSRNRSCCVNGDSHSTQPCSISWHHCIWSKYKLNPGLGVKIHKCDVEIQTSPQPLFSPNFNSICMSDILGLEPSIWPENTLNEGVSVGKQGGWSDTTHSLQSLQLPDRKESPHQNSRRPTPTSPWPLTPRMWQNLWVETCSLLGRHINTSATTNLVC